MMRRKAVLFPGACLFLAALSILVGFGHFAGHSTYNINISDILPYLENTLFTNKPETEVSTKFPLKDGDSTFLKLAPSYINAIMTPEDTSFPRLNCLAPTGNRYEYLQGNATSLGTKSSQLKYYFAIDLRQCASLLPRLVGSIVEAMHFLGPKNCALSIVEGHSDDGTFEILKLLGTQIKSIGAQYYFTSSALNPSAGDRISILAELRNEVLKPLTNNAHKYIDDAVVIFLNDVAICMEDILELLHQRTFQNAEMVCGMDWTYVGPDPTFYDVWVARGITGDSFFNIPQEGDWNSAWNQFWNDSETLTRYNEHKPFQVFSCWNGATVFSSKLVLQHKIKFRNSSLDKCGQGEPQLFCQDIWHRADGKIAVIPTVNLEYSDEKAQKIKDLKGYVSKWVNKDGDGDDDLSMKIEWKTTPPPMVKCMTPLHNQTWLPWDFD